MPKIACTEEEASCLIPSIIAETKTPCPCKGTHFGLNRPQKFMWEYYRKNGSADGWVLKADVHHYFASIRHDVLKQDVRKGHPKGAPFQPGAHEEETAEVQGHVRQRSHDEA